MYCPKCGTQVNENTTFCPKCGFGVTDRLNLIRELESGGNAHTAAMSAAADKASSIAASAKGLATGVARDVSTGISKGTVNIPFLVLDALVFLFATFVPCIVGITSYFGARDFVSLPSLGKQCFQIMGSLKSLADTASYFASGLGVSAPKEATNAYSQIMIYLGLLGLVALAIWIFELSWIVRDARKDFKGEVAKDRAGTGLIVIAVLIFAMALIANHILASRIGINVFPFSVYKKALFPIETLWAYIILGIIVRVVRNRRFKKVNGAKRK
ncbi:MAG: zinc ribbon domain-containing protein [Coriobacteriales bacterium]|nr:zinc ribbon domain-containing protein [Coriobacteriales bacterium]